MIEDSRYLSEVALDEFLSSRPKTAVRISGVPEIQLVFFPGLDGGVALRVDWDGRAMPDLSEYAHLSADIVRTGDRAWAELLINDPDVFRRALSVVWRIADRIQLEQLDFATAVIATLADFRELLEGTPALSPQRELGLFGELTVLDCLVSGMRGSEAVAAWRGPNGDEHDFDLGCGDLEVKCTTSEKRIHWIGSLSQLNPTPGRRLWLLSIQLTTGLEEAVTISELIGKLRSRLAESGRDDFEVKLYAAGWRDGYSAKVRRRFRLRSAPLLLPVTANFPALTHDRVAASGMDISRLREIAYSIDVGGLAEEPCPPAAISELVSEGGIW
jgi:hypothetical protein